MNEKVNQREQIKRLNSNSTMGSLQAQTHIKNDVQNLRQLCLGGSISGISRTKRMSSDSSDGRASHGA